MNNTDRNSMDHNSMGSRTHSYMDKVMSQLLIP